MVMNYCVSWRIGLLMLWLSTPLFAQNDFEAAQKEGALLIDQFVQKIRKLPVIKIHFNYTIESREDHLKEETEGVPYLQPKHHQMRVEMSDQIIVSNGKHLWIIQKDLKEITKDAYDPSSEQINPLGLLDHYKQNFLYASMGIATSPNGQPAHLVELTPHDKSLNYFKVKLFFDKQNDLQFFQIYDKAGVIYTFEIRKLERPMQVSQSLFSVDPRQYAGYTITDLTQ